MMEDLVFIVLRFLKIKGAVVLLVIQVVIHPLQYFFITIYTIHILENNLI